MKRFFKIDSTGRIEKLELKTIIKKKEIKEKEEKFDNLKYLDIGFYLITPLLFFLLIGIYFKKEVFFILLGTVFVFYNLIKIVKK